jgi:cytoskeletal protein RodZ
MTHHDDHLGDDFQPVMNLLEANRPEASPHELDAVKQRVLTRAGSRSHKRRKQGFMRSRAVILATLVLGFTFSTAGAGLAITGFANNNVASVAEYPPNTPPPTTPQTPPTTQVAPGTSEQANETPAPEAQEVLPGTDEKSEAPNDQVEAHRQVAAGVSKSGPSEELPFTGFAAIPVLLLGLALLTGGMVLRRSSRSD